MYFPNKEIACIKCEAIMLPIRKVWSLIQMAVLVLLCVPILRELGGNHERKLIHNYLFSQFPFNDLISLVSWCLIVLWKLLKYFWNPEILLKNTSIQLLHISVLFQVILAIVDWFQNKALFNILYLLPVHLHII